MCANQISTNCAGSPNTRRFTYAFLIVSVRTHMLRLSVILRHRVVLLVYCYLPCISAFLTSFIIGKWKYIVQGLLQHVVYLGQSCIMVTCQQQCDVLARVMRLQQCFVFVQYDKQIQRNKVPHIVSPQCSIQNLDEECFKQTLYCITLR